MQLKKRSQENKNELGLIIKFPGKENGTLEFPYNLNTDTVQSVVDEMVSSLFSFNVICSELEG